MKYFSGFCLKGEMGLFEEYLDEREFSVAGFSYGAQKAVRYVLDTNKRVDKLQLLSPAFFTYNQKIIDLNINAFKRDKQKYIENFIKKAGGRMENGEFKIENKTVDLFECSEKELEEMFTFDWKIIKELKNIKIEVFLGEFDKIIALKSAVKFFKNFGDVYLIKNANHFMFASQTYKAQS